MKYISLDLETAGLNPGGHNILMLSAVVEDSVCPLPLEDLPHFTCYVKPWTELKGTPYALAMNAWILDIISGRTKCPNDYPILSLRDMRDGFLSFLSEHFGDERITIAGKNVASFDMQFLKAHTLHDRFRHRVLDVGPLFVDWSSDNSVPDLKTCKQRAGLGSKVAHDAYEDAIDVIRLLRTKYV